MNLGFSISTTFIVISYLRTQDMLTITSAAAATMSTQSDGSSVAISKPSPKHTADFTLFL